MSMKKKWSAEEKTAAVLEGLKGRGVRELCAEYGMSEALYYRWRDEALKNLQSGFADKRKRENKTQSWESERSRLLRMIGEQHTIIELQKKIANTF